MFPVIPRFIRALEDQYVMEHKDAEFICGVYPPKSEVDWRVKDRSVTNGKKYKLSKKSGEHRLIVKDALEEETGVVTAILGENQCEAQLIVRGELTLTALKYLCINHEDQRVFSI